MYLSKISEIENLNFLSQETLYMLITVKLILIIVVLDPILIELQNFN